MKWINVNLQWVEDFQSRLIDKHGYEAVQVDEGGVGIGDWAMIPPSDNMYFFLIREVYLTAWSSGHQYMKCQRLPKEWEKRVALTNEAI